MKNPLHELEKIYSNLQLTNFEEVKKNFKEYLDSIGNYKTNVYNITEDMRKEIYSHWSFTIDKWGY